MTTSSEMRRAYRGPAIFLHGFRVFFLMAGIWAAVSMLIWILAISSSGVALPGRMAGVDWHMHELVFGYSSAVIAGFLLTAVPNWTGRLPVVGWPVAGLAALWLAGRVALLSQWAGGAFVDLSFLVVLSAVIAREVWTGKNWKNLPVLALVSLIIIANAMYHFEAFVGIAYRGYGVRLGVGMIILLISLIGGRVIPSFTRNWLARRSAGRLPIPFNIFDKATLILSGIFFVGWVGAPDLAPVRWLAIIVGALHLIRLSRWAGERTFGEPLLAILHVGYLFVPVGFLMIGMGSGVPHAWTAGAVGIVTLAMMTRASLGHSGRALTATLPITATYILIVTAAVSRIIGEILPETMFWLHLSATAWILGFALFVIVYFPMLTRARAS